MIGDSITVTVLEKRGRECIRIGIDAPPEIKVMRLEIIDRKPKEEPHAKPD